MGGPGRFAFHPNAHLTEASELVAARARERLLEAWTPYWDLTRRVLVEKSPPNLLRFRLLQALFPGSSLVAIVRHPVAVAQATRPWSSTSLGSLYRHWLTAHSIFEADRPHLERLLFLRYEDVVADPSAALADIDAFVGLERHDVSQRVRSDTNARYLRRWHHSRLVPSSLRVAPYRLRFEARIRQLGYGYSLGDRAR